MIPSLNLALSDRYRVLRELGRGGMATVYLAEDLKLQRHVALKVLRPELAASLGNDRFLREIEIAARLSHPHILALHDSGDAGGHLYYAMPYVEGESLRQRLEREGQLSFAETIAIIQAVAGALTYAHRQGIIHRDIKPENILICRGGTSGASHPLVADFGIARALDAAGGERLTETGLALGTPAYMSPEQAANGRLDGRSDIYALGCVAYEMLAGAPPFTGPTAQTILARHAVDPPPPLRTVRARVPEAVEYAVERALAKVPADRFDTADQFAEALEAQSVVRKPTWRISRFRQRRLAVGSLVAASGIAMGAVFFRGSASPSVLASASRIAVLPLLSLGADTALARLGKDLANTISASLDGVGGIKTADRLTIATSTSGKDLSPTDGAELARSLGATSVVQGTLVGAGNQVRLDLGLYGSERLEPVARGVSVTAHRDSIRTLTDSATLGLLRQVWQRGEPPTPNLAAVTTRSIPALRAFLDGERAMAESRWVDAELAYASAINQDSTFVLAQWRRPYARWWETGGGLDSAELSVALAHVAELPEKERALFEAWSKRRDWPTAESLDRAGALTERFPDFWPGWFEYADQLYHSGPLLGHDPRLASPAFQQVLKLNPGLVPAWEHLTHAAMQLEDTLLITRAMRQLDSLVPLQPSAPRIPVSRMVARMLVDLMKGKPFEGPLADSLVHYAVSPEQPWDEVASATWLSEFGQPAAQIALSRRVLARSTSRGAAFHRRGIALAWAARGAWDSALAAMDQYANRSSDLAALTPTQITATGAGPELAKLDPYRIAVVGAWLGALDAGAATARRESAARAVASLSTGENKDSPYFGTTNPGPSRQTLLYWFDAVLAASRRDLNGLRQARERLIRQGNPQSRRLLRSVNAFELELLGRRREAGDSMAALSREYWNWAEPYFIGINRLAAARWLAAEGDLKQAASLLPWHQAVLYPVDFIHDVVVLEGLSRLELARVESARGNRDLARDYYQRFLQRYDLPSARMQHLADEAAAALARLDADR